MFETNVGGIDRILRIAVGAALILGFFLLGDAPWRWLMLIGVVPLATGFLRTCPLYSLIGIRTCPAPRR